MARHGLLIALLLALSPHLARADDSARPNVLICVADDWGWPDAGAYGNAIVRTPTFDRLAREGVVFDRAFVSSPSCTPSRNAILAGQDFYRLGQGANLWSTLDTTHPNFMSLLRDAGYAIGHHRKAWGPGDFRAGGYEQNPMGPASTFDDFLQQRGDQPFCFWFGTSDPHRPYNPGTGQAAGLDPSDVDLPPYWPDDDLVRRDVTDYYAEVERWDRDVGKAIAMLEDQGLLDNTIVIMTGDHGMPFPRCKGNLYDSGVRVPLAIRWPERTTTGNTDRLVSLTDLAPTILAAAGLEVPEVMTGRSMLKVLRGNETEWRDAIVFGRERHTAAQAMPSLAGYPSRAVRTGAYLYIRNYEPDRWPAGVPEGATHVSDHFADCDNSPTKSLIMQLGDRTEAHRLCFARRPAEELYDLKADPHQVHNLAGDPALDSTKATLRAELDAYLKATGDPRAGDGPAPFDDYPYRNERIMQRVREHNATSSQ